MVLWFVCLFFGLRLGVYFAVCCLVVVVIVDFCVIRLLALAVVWWCLIYGVIIWLVLILICYLSGFLGVVVFVVICLVDVAFGGGLLATFDLFACSWCTLCLC